MKSRSRRVGTRTFTTKVALAVTLSAGVWIACGVTDIHIFIAGQYLPKLDCVTPGYAVDVLNGPQIDASCDSTCVVPPFDSGVYVTGACAPFPEGDDVSGQDPLCAKALAAIHRDNLCLEGGPSNPLVDSGLEGGGEARAPMSAAHDGALLDAGAPRDGAERG